MKRNVFMFASITLFSASVEAASIFIEGGLHIGGDELASADFIGGTTRSMSAGGLLSGHIGLTGDVNEFLEFRSSIGYKFDYISADNGQQTFDRFPLEFILLTKGEVFSFGVGATYHIDPVFSSFGAVGDFDDRYDSAPGFLAEVDYKLNERGYLGLKATVIEYKSSTGGNNLNGNSLGIIIGVRFK